jgi:hypothetical protein
LRSSRVHKNQSYCAAPGHAFRRRICVKEILRTWYYSVYTIWVRKERRNQIRLSPDLQPLAAFISHSLPPSHPMSSPTLLCGSSRRLPSRFTTPLSLLFLGLSDCVPRVGTAGFPGVPQVSNLDLNVSPAIGSYYPVQQVM